MKRTILSLVTLASLTASATGGGGTHGRTITCQDLKSGAVILQFSSLIGAGQFSNNSFDLSVKTRGDDIGNVVVNDKAAQATYIANRSEDVLNAEIQKAGRTVASRQVFDRRGLAEVTLMGDGAQVAISSYERRGEGRLSLQSTNLHIQCQKGQ